MYWGIGNDGIWKSFIGNVYVFFGLIFWVSFLSELSWGLSNFKWCNCKSVFRCYIVVFRCGIGLFGKCNVSEDYIYIYVYIENSMGNLLIYEFFMVFI